MSEWFKAKVKPLEWKESITNPGYWKAEPNYMVWMDWRGPSPVWHAVLSPTVTFPTLQQAKDACEEAHESRVRALLQIEAAQ